VILKKNPVIYSHEDNGRFMNESDAIDMNEHNSTMIAFQMRDYHKKTVFEAPDLAEWKAFITGGDGTTVKTEHRFGVHTCTAEEWKRFYEPMESNKQMFD
jgi:hypothetical protein